MKKEKSARYVRRPYERVRCAITIEGESRTHQSHKDSCDVNKILARYERTGMLPPGRGQPQFADVTGLQGDLTERVNFARETQSQFGSDVNEYRKKEAEKARTPPKPDLGTGTPPPTPAPSGSQVPPGGTPPAGSV